VLLHWHVFIDGWAQADFLA